MTGCTEVSPGCDHCYARTFAERFRGVPGHPFEQGFDLKLWPGRLSYPMQWRKPRRIFVNSMSDLFHQQVPDSFIMEVFAVMAEARQHTFQVLTKRPARLRQLVPAITAQLAAAGYDDAIWPAHLWLGVSVETPQYSWRIDHLRAVPAAVRFISAEPLLAPLPQLNLAGIDWLIAGGESGAGHRPCDANWLRDLRDQCGAAGVAFFFKQWGGRNPKAGGRELDGRTWDEYPTELSAVSHQLSASLEGR